MNEQELNRYSRHIRLPEVGLAGQQRLKKARVLLVGVGGLGCPVAQYLTAAGVGTLGIIDGDVVEESNLQRQILFSPEHIGQNKAEIAAALLSRQNPYIELIAHPTFLDRTNALALLASYDLVVDGSDNFATRYLVNDACVLLGKPLVFGSIYKFDGQVSVFNYGDGPTYRCLYPEPSDLEACSEVGVLGVLPGITGCLMANEAIKCITGIGELLSGTLLVFNALTFSFNTFSFAANPTNKALQTLPETNLSCSPAAEVLELDATDLMDWLTRPDAPLLIDVREPGEYEQDNLGGTLIPLAKLLEAPKQVPADQVVVVHCQSGGRSRKAVEFLHQQGYTQAFNLRGGLNAVRRLGIDGRSDFLKSR
ncbi:molybdopterin-synthase adenylyltransferase MoeB [Spirosoma sp. KUDC1026]|uniref:molybdopterin-synthase adenylyltransferase MoeB n=1 Tax=Spirosoma sp. KUDC1026 TaxID=2745947 RepID=UPI00159B8A9F|nr:molybdopterin-synthase adenylyltransferase MoeB [Spirosoma sp. KUDC1026]QKZ14752.1 molybdopterin-synthase adenylyltransferase MoeB [Spirosoma sp. KUDC1026]